MKISKFSGAHHNVSESVFVEIQSKSKKKLLIGCIYRHPSSAVSEFIEEFFQTTVREITQKEKNCILVGDFNVDLIKYGEVPCVDSFYDHITSHGFRPLILNPTRVTSKSATLIDNFFVNNSFKWRQHNPRNF